MTQDSIELLSDFKSVDNFDPTNIGDVIFALTYEYLTHMHKWQREGIDADEWARVEEIERFVGHQFETLSDEEYDGAGTHFRVFHTVKYQYRHMNDEHESD